MTTGTPPNVKRNLVANLAGSSWFALLTLAVVPVYLRMLGAELYGLIGFHTALQMFSLILDRGLGTAASREIARMSAGRASVAGMRTLVRTLETVYWIAALLIALLMFAAAPLVATHWLHPVHVSASTVTKGLGAMGVVLALQFPLGLYSGVLLGLQQHVRYNAVLIAGTSLRLLLPIAALKIAGPDMVVFFGAQAVGALAQTAATRLLVHRTLPASSERARFDVGELIRLRRFAAGVTIMTLFSVVVLQLDKLMVSHFSSLQAFGYYAIAAAVATGLGVVSLPVYTAVFPRFSQLVARADSDAIRTLYHHATQVISGLVLPLTATIVIFARPLLLFWTRDRAIAEQAWLPLTLLVIAVAASSYTYVPLALQLAEGLTSVAVILNAVGLGLMLPAMTFAAPRWGSPGVALVAAIWQGVAAAAMTIYTDRVLLRRTALRLLAVDVIPPLAATIVIAIAARLLVPHVSGASLMFLFAGSAAASLVAAVCATPVAWLWVGERRRAVQKT